MMIAKRNYHITGIFILTQSFESSFLSTFMNSSVIKHFLTTQQQAKAKTEIILKILLDDPYTDFCSILVIPFKKENNRNRIKSRERTQKEQKTGKTFI